MHRWGWPLFLLLPWALGAREIHLTNIRQLTFGEEKHGEAYFSPDGEELIFQKIPKGKTCYQMYILNLQDQGLRKVSTGLGGTTCGYFFPHVPRILYSSTHLQGPHCPPPVPPDKGRYLWPLDDYDIFSADTQGGGLQRLTDTPGYDAEATVSPDGQSIVFTSLRDGDLDLYVMGTAGGPAHRLTHELGYDGGAFFSPDGQRIVYRAFHPKGPQDVQQYRQLLAQGLVRPSRLEIFVMRADGSQKHQVTSNGMANFAPFFHPSGKRIIFSSNLGSGPSFHLYLINDDGTELEQVSFEGHFNSFPMFSPDGTKLVWASDRASQRPGEFHLFMAQWAP